MFSVHSEDKAKLVTHSPLKENFCPTRTPEFVACSSRRCKCQRNSAVNMIQELCGAGFSNTVEISKRKEIIHGPTEQMIPMSLGVYEVHELC